MKRSREEPEQDDLTPPVFNGFPSDGTIRSTRDFRPAHFTLKIESYSLLCETGTETYESGIFEAGGHKWILCFYPKGNCKSGGNNHISLYLRIADTTSLPLGWEINAKFTFLVFDQIHDKYLAIQDGSIRRFHEMKTEWGVPQLLSLDIFNDVSQGYLIDDCCIFGVEVFVLKHTGRMECLSIVKKPSNNVYTWKIENVSSALNTSRYSEGFTVQGIPWKLLVTPKVDGTGHSAYLCCFDDECLTSNKKVYAEYILRLKNQLDINRNLDNTARYWFGASPKNGWGFNGWISSSNLKDTSKGYVLDDTLILEVEIVAMSVTKSLS